MRCSVERRNVVEGGDGVKACPWETGAGAARIGLPQAIGHSARAVTGTGGRVVECTGLENRQS